MSQYGVINTIQPPSLDGTTQPELISFEVRYSTYTERVENVNRDRPVSERVKAASIRKCLKPKLLHSLRLLGKISGASTAEFATDEAVKEWFEGRLSSEAKDLSSRVNDAIKSVEYKDKPRDPAHAPEAYVLEVVTALDEHNASEIIKDMDQSKELLRRLCMKLEPPELKQRMINAMKMWSTEQKGDLGFFVEKAGEFAEHVAAGESARKQLKRRADLGSSSSTDRDNYSQHGNKKKHKPNDKMFRKKVPFQKNPGDHDKKWDKPCLNEEFPEYHRIRDCKITPPGEKIRLFNELREKNKIKVSVLASAIQTERNLTVEIEGVPFKGVGDTGADINAISETMLKDILKSNSDVVAKEISNPFRVELATNTHSTGSLTPHARKKIITNLIIYLPESNIPLRITSVSFLVLDQEMDEVVLGRPLLKILGFDLDQHLARIRDLANGKSVSEIEKMKLASLVYQGMRYNSFDDDPIPTPQHLAAGFGEDSIESITEAFNELVLRAGDNGMSTNIISKLRQTLEEYRDVFRIKLGPDPPAQVATLVIKPLPNARPAKSPQRRYAQDQRAFISSTIKQLEQQGAVVKNNDSRWASPALDVPKPGSNTLRFTVDLRGPNSQTEPLQPTLPHLESYLQDCKGSKFFANIDFCHGYWQLPLSKDSQEMMSIQTPEGVFTPTRVVQGGTDSGNHFQNVTREQFAGKVNNLIQWLDEFLVYARTEEELLREIRNFLEVCRNIGFKVNPTKSSFFETEVKFCGRIISESGVRYDPRNIDALKAMKSPERGPDLQQFICALNWMRTAIPDFARTVQPLQDLMETVYKKAQSRTKRGIRKISLEGMWMNEHEQCFRRLLSQLSKSTELSHRKEKHELCLFTDASDTHWSAILTQRPTHDRLKPIEDQCHEPLGFNSGSFKGPSRNWSVPEKEDYAVVEAMCRFNYIIANSAVTIFTDHSNLVYIYNPLGTNSGIARHTASKLMRWALKLSAFRYVIEFVPGDRNVWADLLTRWAVQESTPDKTFKMSKLMLAPVHPSMHPEFDWPSKQELSRCQSKCRSDKPSNLVSKDGLLTYRNGRIWIPGDAKNIQLRLMIAAHTGRGGYRKKQATIQAIQAKFFWSSIQSDVQAFVESCMHCLCTDGGDTIPRPLGHALHASAPNELIHFDYCYMGRSETGHKYVLIVKDDLSGYVWLRSTKETDATTTADILISWFASFGIFDSWMSDRGSHFRNRPIEELQNRLKSKHHFTIPYCPWSNGTVEVVCRELLRACRALTSEFQIPASGWPSIIPLIQSVLNSAPSPRLNNRCPLTVFTGLPQDTPILAIVRNGGDIPTVHDISRVRAEALVDLEKTQNALSKVHKEFVSSSSRKRKYAVDSHNKRTGVRQINFDVGDFVLKGKLSKDSRTKLSLKWTGPFRVTYCRDDYIFEVEHLVSSKRELVHGRRLKCFRNQDFEITEEIKDHLAYQENELLTVEGFDDIRTNEDKVQVLVKWIEFSDEERDWVDAESL